MAPSADEKRRSTCRRREGRIRTRRRGAENDLISFATLKLGDNRVATERFVIVVDRRWIAQIADTLVALLILIIVV